MTDHTLASETSGGGDVAKGCVRVVCACGWEGVWMPPTLPDADDVERPTAEYIPVLMEQLRANGHDDRDPVDFEEKVYQVVLARLQAEGHL